MCTLIFAVSIHVADPPEVGTSRRCRLQHSLRSHWNGKSAETCAFFPHQMNHNMLNIVLFKT